MTEPLGPKGRHEHLLRVVTSERFLNKEGGSVRGINSRQV